MLRRRPVIGAPVAHGASDHLKRTIGTFQLTMFGVGATVGTGIFFVLSVAVPEAGPASSSRSSSPASRLGWRRLCYAELASAVPVSGSTYSYAYTTLGEFVAMGVAACLLLEYGVSIAAVAVGWSGYLNKLLDNLFGFQIPHALSAAPWDADPGVFNLPAVVLIVMCALLLIRGASESAAVNTVMVVIKLGVLALFAIIAFTAFNADQFRDFAPMGFAGIGTAAGTIFFSYIGLDAVSTAGDEVKDPQTTMPQAIIAAWLIVTSVYVLVARRGARHPVVAGLRDETRRRPAWRRFSTTSRQHLGQYRSRGGRGHLDLLGDAGGDVRPDPHPVRHGSRRPAAVPVRQGQPEDHDTGGNTIIVAVIVSILAGFVPLDKLADMVSIGTLVAFMIVSLGVIILRVREPDLPRAFKVPLYPVTPILSILACGYILYSLHWYTWIAFSIWVSVALIFYLLWSRHHSALNDGGDGVIAGAAPGVEDVEVIHPKDVP